MSDTLLADFSRRRKEWEKELRGLERRWLFSFLFIAILVAFSGILAVFTVGSQFEGKPYNQWRPNAITLGSLGLVVVLALTLFVPLILTGGLSNKIRNLRAKSVALLEVRIEPLPDKVLLLWQYYGCLEMQWELVTPAEVASRLARQYQTEFVLVTQGGCEGYESVLAFLRSWDDNTPARKQMAVALGDRPANIREDCRMALYLAEFERTQITAD